MEVVREGILELGFRGFLFFIIVSVVLGVVCGVCGEV